MNPAQTFVQRADFFAFSENECFQSAASSLQTDHMDLNPEKRIAGVLAPIFALRGAHDLGIGDTEALKELIDWSAGFGIKLVQLLPINETGPDNSPYNAISSVALDPATLAVTPETVRDLTPEDYAEVVAGYDLAALREGAVNYVQVKTLKQQLLEKAFNRFATHILAKARSRSKPFHLFCIRQAAWLDGYSLFRALVERHGHVKWDNWPEEHRSAAAARQWLETAPYKTRVEFERRMKFFSYVQWLAFAQWKAVRDYADARGVALMGDVPFGVSYFSADVFGTPGLFDLEWSGGAPPEKMFKSDPFTEKWGQNWGIPLYNWTAMKADNFAWWRQRVSSVREVFHLFRIDHVLGCYRIYAFPWRPEHNAEFLPLDAAQAAELTGGRLPRFQPNDDLTPENAAANCAHGEDFLRVLIAEAGAFCLVGEDLGMVPDYVRPSLTKLDIAGFKIPQWETTVKDGDTLMPGENYPRLSVATYATHDHAPLKTHWNELLAAVNAPDWETRQHAWHEMQKLAAFAKMGPMYSPPAYTDAIREALLGALFSSNAWLAIVMITDFLASEQRFNVPGAIADSNWSARLEESIAEWADDGWIYERMESVRAMIAASGR
jgi:4-alpha-glucanotransferase